MRVKGQQGNWSDRIVAFFVVGSAVLVFGTVVLQEVFDVDVEPAIELIATTVGLDGGQALYLIMGTVFVLVGLATVARRGLPAFDRAVTLTRNDPVPVGNLHLESGTVEVESTAEPIDAFGILDAPYSGTECLGFRYESKEPRRGFDDDNDWRIVDRGQRAVPFTVSDGSGTVVVDPEAATLTFDRDVVSNTGRRIETEWRLEPGESVYVSGRKRDGTSDPDAPGDVSTYIGAGDDASAFTVSDVGETRTVLRFVAKGTVLSLVGLLFLGAGLALLYFTRIV